MQANEERDEWLMTQVRHGKRECLEPLIRRYASPLLTFIRRMVGDPHRSEELFQEVFLAVWAKRRSYQFPRSFRAWLYAIAMNKCHEAFRRRSPPTIPFKEDDAAAPVSASGGSPADVAIATETATMVTAAVTQLPPQQRVVVVLRIWDGLSYAEIAEVTNRAEATVRSNMHHGLAGLRKYLEPRLR